MVELTGKKDLYLSHFERFEQGSEEISPSWLLPTRKAAMSHFSATGFPTTQHEEWQYTNVSPIARTAYTRAANNPAQITRDQLEPFIHGENSFQLVFVDGLFCETLSSIESLSAGVTIKNLAKAFAEDQTLLEEHLGRHASYKQQPFIALNTALMEDGAYIHISKSTVVEKPIHVIHVTTAQPTATMTNPHHLFIVDTNSQATIIETYVGLDEGEYFTNAVTEIVAHENAIVDHYKIVQESDRAYHVAALHVHQFRSSDVSSHVLSLNGKLIRNDIHAILDGEGCECTLNGLYLTHDGQLVDNHLVVDHAQPHCNSREFFKGVLDGKSKGVFSGRIIVREDAQKTDAKQTNMTLPLSEDAQVECKPQLEIYADDVKCTHGATIGQVDEEAIFYLRTRGISKEAAKSLLVYAFIGESLDQIRIKPLRDQVEQWLLAKLPQGRMFRESV